MQELLQELNLIIETIPDEKIKDLTSNSSPWDEENEPIYKFGNAKQVESEYYDLVWDFGVDDAKDEADVIGDFVKNDLTEDAIESAAYNADMDVIKLKNLSQILAINDQIELEKIEYDHENNRRSGQSNVEETPIIPDFEIDYDNIYDNIESLVEIEKHLQLLYRPFTCVVDVNCRFRLHELAILMDDVLYEPTHHPALFVRLRNPSAELKLYAGGKITSSALTASAARMALLKVIHMVENLNYNTDITNFSKNIVHASFCLPFKIDLEMLSEMHSDHVIGNREMRPFITYKIDGTAIRFAIFPNGYVLVLHSTQHSETRAAIVGILPILAQFRNGYLTPTEKNGSLRGDISFKVLWERKLEDDKGGLLLYS
ncbi:uncharacterized protein LOC6562861 [Drosophila grimshawi]|uniref:GH11160 n=1 Tax=Drosophila grimshawi TaxID=7222 RepID=B4JDC5_DROGR|nr:uncharacterized protein LOC6562861 [Drosophila grimshawi]EDW03298.1 GH11160 [Drosophila grimshawi]